MKIDFKAVAKKGLPLVGGALTLLGMVVSSAIDSNNRNDMKAELKDEILEEMLKNK